MCLWSQPNTACQAFDIVESVTLKLIDGRVKRVALDTIMFVCLTDKYDTLLQLIFNDMQIVCQP